MSIGVLATFPRVLDFIFFQKKKIKKTCNTRFMYRVGTKNNNNTKIDSII